MVSVTAVKIQFSSPSGVLRSVCLPGMRSMCSLVRPCCRTRLCAKNHRSATCKPPWLALRRGHCLVMPGEQQGAQPAAAHLQHQHTPQPDLCGLSGATPCSWLLRTLGFYSARVPGTHGRATEPMQALPKAGAVKTSTT